MPRLETATEPRARIAVVDDEPAVARFMSRMLRMHGYDVWVEPDCSEVLSRLAERPGCIDLLLTDQVMPGMTGSELVRKARVIRPALPVMLVSGYSADVSSHDVRAWGASAYLAKPVDSAQLLSHVERLLDGAA